MSLCVCPVVGALKSGVICGVARSSGVKARLCEVAEVLGEITRRAQGSIRIVCKLLAEHSFLIRCVIE
jgi:hypothetical protein